MASRVHRPAVGEVAQQPRRTPDRIEKRCRDRGERLLRRPRPRRPSAADRLRRWSATSCSRSAVPRQHAAPTRTAPGAPGGGRSPSSRSHVATSPPSAAGSRCPSPPVRGPPTWCGPWRASRRPRRGRARGRGAGQLLHRGRDLVEVVRPLVEGLPVLRDEPAARPARRRPVSPPAPDRKAAAIPDASALADAEDLGRERPGRPCRP